MDFKELEELHRMEKSVCQMYYLADNLAGQLANRVSRFTGKGVDVDYNGSDLTYIDDESNEFNSIEDITE